MVDKKDVQSNIRIFRGFAQLLALSFELTKQEDEKESNEYKESQENVSYYYY